MRLIKDYTFNYLCQGVDYGQVTVPKGTAVSHNTAMGPDPAYHFVSEFGWVDPSNRIMLHDMQHYGINVPKEFIDYSQD